MTFEEIYDRLSVGGSATSFADASEMLRVIQSCRRHSGVMLALLLNESKRFFSGDGWAKWAVETHELKNENFVHHRQKVGEMLRALHGESEKVFQIFLGIKVSILDAWTALYHYGTTLPDTRDCAPLLNFLKSYPESPGWKRDKLRAVIKSFLKPNKGCEEGAPEHPELDLKFDALGTMLSDAALSELTRNEGFDADHAFIMAYNGAKLCSHAVVVIKSAPEQFTPEQLEDIEDDLNRARQTVRSLILKKRNSIPEVL